MRPLMARVVMYLRKVVLPAPGLPKNVEVVPLVDQPQPVVPLARVVVYLKTFGGPLHQLAHVEAAARRQFIQQIDVGEDLAQRRVLVFAQHA